ncbi:hypothetical protein OOK60_15665 [Trichothermofontia sichuanensis B231]|uniref:hypothetical protein n=1 Tax=Trichothermofontia sichuanensis TaxID=3045816 RepID=UPI00224737BA|nr:hypothetical protein [Trichothermofontia sichuanensis]UZQ53908.1 hypothetical protein OOK60_15665 [Trichothermofontia sichuanensis B231]
MVAIVPLSPVYAQVLPQGWGAIGSKEGEASYAIGARWLDFGVELGGTRQGATGVDVLKFIPLPIISPYAGIGVYSADESLVNSALHRCVHRVPPGFSELVTTQYEALTVNSALSFK